jgi:hypothetical protein
MTFSRMVSVLSAAALLSAAVPLSVARADAVGPSVLVLSGGRVLFSNQTVSVCAGRPVRFVGSANDTGDGLGVPFSGTRLIYAWNFGSGTPASSLDVFANQPTARFTSFTSVSLTVFDKIGNSTLFRFNVSPVTCGGPIQ